MTDSDDDGAGGGGSDGADDRRSVVLVTFDSLRADHCGHHGYDRDTTPTMDALAEAGVAFERAIAPGPSTPESMPAVLTGDYPTDVRGEFPSLLAERRAQLRRHMRSRETLAERFRRRGYATAGFSPNPYTSRYFGFDAGFDRYEDFVGGTRERLYDGLLDGTFAGTALSAVLPVRVLLNWVQGEEVFKPWADFLDGITGWLDGVDRPFFLWVLLMDTHDPYLPPAGDRTQSRLATYHANWRLWRQGHQPPFDDRTRDRLVRAFDDATRYADRFVARLREGLADRGHDPVLAVHADHGEAFGEHGTYGHQQRLYEENVHVPFVISGLPDETRGYLENRADEPFPLSATPELLLAAAAGRRPSLPGAPVRARTLAGDRVAYRGRNWKYIEGPDGPGAAELYDLAADPGETRNLLADGESSAEGDGARTDEASGGLPAPPETVAAAGRALAARWRDDRAERRAVADAVATAFADEDAATDPVPARADGGPAGECGAGPRDAGSRSGDGDPRSSGGGGRR